MLRLLLQVGELAAQLRAATAAGGQGTLQLNVLACMTEALRDRDASAEELAAAGGGCRVWGMRTSRVVPEHTSTGLRRGGGNISMSVLANALYDDRRVWLKQLQRRLLVTAFVLLAAGLQVVVGLCDPELSERVQEAAADVVCAVATVDAHKAALVEQVGAGAARSRRDGREVFVCVVLWHVGRG